MPELIPAARINEFFQGGFEHTAWRLETRRTYDAAYSTDRFRQFLEGQDPGVGGLEPWMDLIRELTSEGKRVERVRLVDKPPTDYQLFMLNSAVHNIAAGEDIRYLWRSEAEGHTLPDEDFWLFDSRTVARFHYDGEISLGMEVINDPATVLPYCQARDAAWHYATRYTQFKAEVASTA